MGRTKRLNVLVVEDHPEIGMVIGMIVRMLGHHAVLAGDGDAALSQTRDERFDVLLADIDLPGMSGWQLIAAMREQGQMPPFAISMSAWTPPDDPQRSARAGYHAHLVKPFRLESLEALLARNGS